MKNHVWGTRWEIIRQEHVESEQGMCIWSSWGTGNKNLRGTQGQFRVTGLQVRFGGLQ